ncbi:MAG: sugar transferase [Chloroflexi bacterium]|nr:sugar transferase [Chloroflexota bacterium]
MRDFCTRTFDLALATGRTHRDLAAAADRGATHPARLAGPALFRQRRLGLRSQPFVCPKFRTMHIEPDDRPHCEALSRAANGLKKVT